MVMKSTTLCLLALALFGSLCDAQQYKPTKPGQGHQTPSFPQQTKQIFEKPLLWKYPEDPKPEERIEGTYELRYPVTASPVAVECREGDTRIEVKKDFFGIGQFINPNDLTLGDCPVQAEDNVNQVLIFEVPLHTCGSAAYMTDDSIIYSFVLNYNPTSFGDTTVVRTNKAAVNVDCFYVRKHNVSSFAIDPVWLPYSSLKIAEEFLYFSLTLMTKDWVGVRPAIQYFLGDMINIEAKVMQYHHVPLRVYIQSCVASLSQDPAGNPSYTFLDSGCMVDRPSRFIGRTSENVIQFYLEAFRFHEAESGNIYITCHLLATSTSYPASEYNRACSYINGVWRELSGNDNACHSCELLASKSGSGVSHHQGGGSGGSGSTWSSGGSGGNKKAWTQSSGSGTSWTQSSGSGSAWTQSSGSTSGSGTTLFPRKERDVSTKNAMPAVVWDGKVTLGPIPIGQAILN